MPNYQPNSTGKCPHCLTSVRFEHVAVQTSSTSFEKVGTIYLDAPSPQEKKTEHLILTTAACPECGGLVITVQPRYGDFGTSKKGSEYIVWPLRSARPVPKEVLALQRRFILLRHVEYYYDVLRRGRLVDDGWCFL